MKIGLVSVDGHKCPWCVVPNKEGYIRPNADIDEFIDGRKEAVEQKRIARWCNHKAIFNTVKYEDYQD